MPSLRHVRMPVESLTVKGFLTAVALTRYEHAADRFCPDATCAVVYFAERGPAFTTAHVRERVWQKEPPATGEQDAKEETAPQLDLELDTAFHVLKWFPEEQWLRCVELRSPWTFWPWASEGRRCLPGRDTIP